MGLSNRERTGKIFYCVKEIIEKTKKLNDHLSSSYGHEDKMKRLIYFCDNLWPSLIGMENNSNHWLIGSSSNNLVTVDNEDLWSIAVCSSLPYVSSNGQINNDDLLTDKSFNPLSGSLTIKDFLHHAEKPGIKIVCEIYELLEGIVYALRRYNDNYLKDKKIFSDLIANMQGTCFSILYNNNYFTLCYVANQICRILYNSSLYNNDEEYKDVVDEWLYEDNMHHDITRAVARAGESLEWLVKQHIILIESKDAELKKNRALVAIRMAGRRFHCDYRHKNMIKIFAKDKDLSDDVFLASVEKEIKACKKSKTDDEECSSASFNNENSPHMLYGHLFRT